MANGPHYEGDPKAITTGNGKEIVVKPKALNIIWGNDKRYWERSEDDSKPAELLQVCWLEVTGAVDIPDPNRPYKVTFRLSLTPDAFGWGGAPIYIMAKRGKTGKFVWTKELLTSYAKDGSGEFEITRISKPDPENHGDTKLYFGLYEVWSGKWKGGLRIHGVRVEDLASS